MERSSIDSLPARAKRTYQARSLLNLLRTGHCAPTVMRTVLEITHTEQEWLVKLAAGLPGGIGNTGGECGAFTSPLILLGLRYGLHEMRAGLPVLFDIGHAFQHRFLHKNASISCKEIQGRCVPAILHAPRLLAETPAADREEAIPPEQRAAYSGLYTYLREQNFHCAHAVLGEFRPGTPTRLQLWDATSAFLGGTLFQGLTCSAFAAGVMAIGLKTGQIENNYVRVLRMLIKGVDIADENANKFHRTINAGQRLSEWFVSESGRTQCRAITGCNFSYSTGVEEFIACGCVAACKQFARRVAEKAQTIIGEYGKGL